jgi:hypothetical protein
MKSGWVDLVMSALTAGIISGGGALGVISASGNTINQTAIWLCIALGAVSAAQDYRSQMKLPPVEPPTVAPSFCKYPSTTKAPPTTAPTTTPPVDPNQSQGGQP